MQTIRLERGEWSYDEGHRLGPPGGFGEVFKGFGDGMEVAIKRLKLSAGAASHREMKIGAALAERTYPHVVPVLDYGQDADSDRYYLVMPVSEHSLQDVLKDGPLSLVDAKKAALEIVTGLQEVADIVHRDLKPGNVLWHEGRWKIADFGIAKFVEDATSLESLRTSLTPPYAAPEQWRGERPTGATDVYALGCIIHATVTGRPPFQGSQDDVREAHLHKPAPALAGVDNRLAGLVATMLRKAPASRPSLSRCASVLAELHSPMGSGGREALAAAANAVSQEEAAADAAKSAAETAHQQRRELVREALDDIKGIVGRLFETIEKNTHSAKRETNAVALGPAHLSYAIITSAASAASMSGDVVQSGWHSLAHAFLYLRATERVRIHAEDPGYYRFGVTLCFARTPNDAQYRWREIAFHEAFSRGNLYEQPFGLDPSGRDFQIAVSNVIGRCSISHGPYSIDGEDEDAFQERWLKLFAKAAERRLSPPTMLPLHDSFFS